MIREFQESVRCWLVKHLGLQVADDKHMRCSRYCEESIELLQSLDYPKSDILALVDYVYDRPVGDPFQEVGGVQITLNALCCTKEVGIDIEEAGAVELERIHTPSVLAKLKLKNDTALPGSPLPGPGRDSVPGAETQ